MVKESRIEVIIDSAIPFIKGVLEPYCKTKYIKGEEITSSTIGEAKALIIRTRTKCDAQLLEGSEVEAIFTATIGVDHIDIDYCAERGIKLYSAAGCNANGVVQYFFTTLFALMAQKRIDYLGERIGVIGAGSVGERVATFAEEMGFEVMRCDPPKSLVKNKIDYYSLEEVLESCKIITLHLPLTEETRGLFSDRLFKKMREGTLFFNSARGEVVEERALIANRARLAGVVVDVWNSEPNIDIEYLHNVDIATPHIAGYSLEGKINGTLITLRNFASHFKNEELKRYRVEAPDLEQLSINKIEGASKIEQIAQLLLERFPIWEEDKKMRAYPQNFEKQRVNYHYRREIDKSLKEKIICLAKSS